MAISILAIALVLAILGATFIGKQIRGNDLRSVAGFLTAVTVVARFLSYTMLALPVYFFALLSFGSQSGDGLNLSIPARIKLDPGAISVAGMENTEITRIIGTLQLSNPDITTIATSSIFIFVLVILLHFALKNTQLVLKSISERNPFIEPNAKRLRLVALLALVIWCVAGIYRFYISLYLQKSLELEGFNIVAGINISFGALFICGLILVLSEVFRVGYELKCENELTV